MIGKTRGTEHCGKARTQSAAARNYSVHISGKGGGDINC